MSQIEIPYLIVGAGPAGASLACFLASHGQTGIMVSMASGTAKEPRAHINNPAALECLREIGLEQDCLKVATPQSHMQHTRWCHDVAGRELARIHSWGNQPKRRGSYDAASPCHHVDLPQTLLEPILVGHATAKGWKIRFDTQFLNFTALSDGSVKSELKDLLSGTTYTIHSKYLFGCDGARSQVIRQLDIPLDKKPGQGLAINLLVRADLHKHMRYRTGNLHWIFQPEVEHPPWGWTCVLRMVKAWDEWMFIILPEPGFEDLAVLPSEADYLKRVRQLIGDDSVKVEILDASKWYINEIVATRYSEGNIFCLGDAVHRHPPFNGLGSNTCIQDAYNLAWKVAFVEKRLASPTLLDTYSQERQPVGAGVVQRANQGLRDHMAVWEALGVLPTDVEERKRQHAELTAQLDAGQIRRKQLQEAVAYTEHEFGAIGIEMNLAYNSSAIYLKDEGRRPALPEDPVLHYQITTYPGSRLPHAWLNDSIPDRAPVSTQDVAGHGTFCLFTGNGGDSWQAAAKLVSSKTGIVINCVSIGWDQDYEDVYGDWARRREVADDGAVLCRPDRIVCWRSMSAIENADEKLLQVMQSVVGMAT
ncbi:hypothetical protein AMS68_002691 [Peltaster fructicola]|uniref:FAD-binding domain-containing protein n=1 Tax=Peltaster fructicola TaxID=286661 RepID=A0A6H0XR16_9PEZI|nr:hypothetical protein AMS68_002691 [Peltaster fructicola]